MQIHPATVNCAEEDQCVSCNRSTSQTACASDWSQSFISDHCCAPRCPGFQDRTLKGLNCLPPRLDRLICALGLVAACGGQCP